VSGYLGAPTCAMFILAMFWSRTNEPGAFWSMVIAQLWGLSRFIMDFIYPSPSCGKEDTRPSYIINFHEYYHTSSEILLTFVIAILISLCTKRIPIERLAGLTYWTRYQKPLKDIEQEKARNNQLKTVAFNGDNREFDSVYEEPAGPPSACDAVKAALRTALIGAPDQRKSASGGKNGTPDDDTSEDYSVRVAILKQTNRMRIFLNINAALVASITIFLLVFYA